MMTNNTGNRVKAGEQIEAFSHKEAIALFALARNRLFDINSWHVFTGYDAGTFKLVTAKGELLNRAPRQGDLIRVDVKGPGLRSLKKNEWMVIEEMHESYDHNHDEDYCELKIRPVYAPDSPRSKHGHFYTEDACMAFVVQRQGKVVVTGEKVNITELPGAHQEIKPGASSNDLIANLHTVQWNTIIRNLLLNKLRR
ncbi:MAG TPA: hypothetical protein VK177_11255 [Flavobacteriales bacterium]|nr:hypothetical protein [Flavobacteriales bacterium]